MKPIERVVPFLVSVFALTLFVMPALAQGKSKQPATYPALPSEIPAQFKPVTDTFDYTRRTVMIPMRDGVKLHTVILIPKGAKKAPILLTRTPYNADNLTSHAESAHLGSVLQGYDNAVDVILEGGYIRVVQDVRGKHGSEGDYIVNRPVRGPQNPTPVDHATDTYDTIDWLVKNVPESNAKVGILGISYNGFLPLMALVNPHPALKVSVPMNPMVDGWMGDDWFHYGAFRQLNVSWIYNQVATRKGDAKWWRSHNDEYDMWMKAVSAGELGRRRGMDQLGFWNKLVEHPAYDAFWQDQAVDKLLAAQPLKVPVMLVHSLWDQEDIYGAPAVYKAIKPKDTGNDKVFFVIGPWHHGQMIGNGSSLGAVKFGSDTALHFRKKILAPFLAQYLIDGAPKADIAAVTAFETGTNEWRRYSTWPPKDDTGNQKREATVLPLDVEVRSGPAKQYFATSRLKMNDTVQVLRESKTAPGWLEIVPPAGSFSWVNAKFVQNVGKEVFVDCDPSRPVPVLPGSRIVDEPPNGEGIKLTQRTPVVVINAPRKVGKESWVPIAPLGNEVRYIPTAAVRVTKAGPTVTGKPTPLYLRAGLKLSKDAPKAGDTAFEEYISDPAKPVPFVRRPMQAMGYEEGNIWPRWLVEDQREASGRTDVVTFISDVLTEPMKITGEPIANLVASTSGTDSDWVVKLIDVYPDEVAGDAAMGGYQLMIAADIFRGRYRESFAKAKAITPDTPLLYRFALPNANHVFLPGHRLMVQVQSSWFPLYDRNPQTFVPNIFWAKAGDYKKATQRVYHSVKQSSFIELPVAAAK